MKLLKEELSSGVESSYGVKSRRWVNSNQQNIEHVISSSSLFHRLVTAVFDVRFQPRHGVEVSVERSITAVGVAANSHELGVGDLDVSGESYLTPVSWFIIVLPYHLQYATRFNKWSTASRSVQSFLHSSRQKVHILYNGPPLPSVPPSKFPFRRRHRGPIHASLDPPEPTTQTASRSVQRFLQGSLTDRPTDRQTTLLSL